MKELEFFSEIYKSLGLIDAYLALIDKFSIKGLQQYKEEFKVYATLKEWEAKIDATIQILHSIEADITTKIADELELFLKNLGLILKAVEKKDNLLFVSSLSATQKLLKNVMITLEGDKQ